MADPETCPHRLGTIDVGSYQLPFLHVPTVADVAPCAFLLLMKRSRLGGRKTLIHRILEFAYMPKFSFGQELATRRTISLDDADFDHVTSLFDDFDVEDFWSIINRGTEPFLALGTRFLPAVHSFVLTESDGLHIVGGRLHSARSWLTVGGGHLKISDFAMDCTDRLENFRCDLVCVIWLTRNGPEDELVFSARVLIQTFDYGAQWPVGKFYTPCSAPQFEFLWKRGQIELKNFDYQSMLVFMRELESWPEDFSAWVAEASLLACSTSLHFAQSGPAS